MPERALRILQISTSDSIGGGHVIPWNLFCSYRARGYGSWLAVGYKNGDDPDVLAIPRANYRGSWRRLWLSLEKRLQSFEGIGYAVSRSLLRTIANPADELGPRFGAEDFNHPGTYRLLELVPNMPDVLHCHNLHGGYFDLRSLPWLSKRVPVILTLHDAWLLTGHCAHSLDCERWKAGCGRCPDLTLYPAIRHDSTAYNWRRKQRIYTGSRLYVATPSRWLMDKVAQSMIAPAVVEARVIPNGVDQSIFCPADQRQAKEALQLPAEAKILLCVGNRIQSNIWKDYKTMRAAIGQAAERLQKQRVVFIALGEDGPGERIGQMEVRCLPYQKDSAIVARYYQAADLYIHAARADTFPTTILEALACGTPVVATAVGGIPEQVKGLKLSTSRKVHWDGNTYGRDKATGLLVPPAGVEEMADGIGWLLEADLLRRHMSENAAREAHERFDLERQVDDYLGWYEELAQVARAARETAAASS
jgi:glycosyltransferase involved in cell wall biosynthesis